jgi:hypothetical protein
MDKAQDDSLDGFSKAVEKARESLGELDEKQLSEIESRAPECREVVERMVIRYERSIPRECIKTPATAREIKAASCTLGITELQLFATGFLKQLLLHPVTTLRMYREYSAARQTIVHYQGFAARQKEYRKYDENLAGRFLKAGLATKKDDP